MKKLYALTLLTLSFVVNGQNLVTNGNLETWTNSTTPESFSVSPFTAAVTQESTTVHGGTYSAKHTTAATSSVKIQNETAVLVPGSTYTVSYWFLDNDTNARSRPWIYFLDSANATLTDTSTDADFRPTTYSEDNASWIQFSKTFVAPAGAVKLRFEMRTYAVGSGLGSVYYDDMSVTQVLSVNQNDIAGLSIYPNPVSNGALYINTDANDERNVAIFDVLGKQVVNVTTSNTAINVANLNGGVYIVKVTENGKTATRKLVIK
mgnify:CR=1 FL=1